MASQPDVPGKAQIPLRRLSKKVHDKVQRQSSTKVAYVDHESC